MSTHTTGLHHVTAIAGDPQENLTFYTTTLGLRFVKRTVNFDDPSTYHLYYGDEVGHPGTALTFFPFQGAAAGRVGRGQTSATAFVIPDDAVEFWTERLADRGVDVDSTHERFDEIVIPFRDHDGQPLELVTGTSDIEPWKTGPVPVEHAIRGFHGVTIDSLAPDRTDAVLETLGYERRDSSGGRIRYSVPGDRATVVDLLDRTDGPRGRQGVGTVHHIAFRAADEAEQDVWRERITDLGLHVTPRKDRQYFRSIYFREPGGVLFEIATDGPGFTRDESIEELGTSLRLPPWLEDNRAAIDRQLAPLEPVGVR